MRGAVRDADCVLRPASCVLRHNATVRWHYRDPLLLWLLPAAYACHLIEEWLGGFPRWISRVIGAPLPDGAFLAINAVALTIMLAAIRAARRDERHGWMGVAVATILFTNGIAHLLGSVATGSYSPGLFTGVVLYLPLASLVLLRAWTQAGEGGFGRGVASGLGLHALVFVIAYAASI
jgi:hypothetical protein